jgi:MFS family permease
MSPGSGRERGPRRRVAAFAVALFAFGFGEELWSRFLPEYLRTLGASALVLGAWGTLRDLLDAAYAYPGGVLSDRLGSSRALLLFGALTTLGIACYLTWSSIPAIFAGLFLVMAWRSLGLPASFALIAEELRGGGRLVGFTVQAVVKRVPIVLAPPLGGLLIERFGMRGGLRLGFAISLLLSAGMLLGLWRAFRLRDEAKPVRSRPAAPVRLQPALRQLLVADCLIRLCEGLPDVFLVVWAIEVVRVSPAQFGVLVAVLTATSILSYLPAVAFAERVERKPFVVLTYVFFTLFPVAVLCATSFPQLVGAYVLGGLREIGEPARKSLIVDLADETARGRTVGLYYAIRGFVVAGAAAIGGVLWTFRPAFTFLAAAALGALGTAWALLFLPSKRPDPVIEGS